MPTPTEAAQFHIFSIKRMKYMPNEKKRKQNGDLLEKSLLC